MHTRGHVELGSEHVTVHIGVLAELIGFQAARGGASGAHHECLWSRAGRPACTPSLYLLQDTKTGSCPILLFPAVCCAVTVRSAHQSGYLRIGVQSRRSLAERMHLFDSTHRCSLLKGASWTPCLRKTPCIILVWSESGLPKRLVIPVFFVCSGEGWSPSGRIEVCGRSCSSTEHPRAWRCACAAGAHAQVPQGRRHPRGRGVAHVGP